MAQSQLARTVDLKSGLVELAEFITTAKVWRDGVHNLFSEAFRNSLERKGDPKFDEYYSKAKQLLDEARRLGEFYADQISEAERLAPAEVKGQLLFAAIRQKRWDADVPRLLTEAAAGVPDLIEVESGQAIPQMPRPRRGRPKGSGAKKEIVRLLEEKNNPKDIAEWLDVTVDHVRGTGIEHGLIEPRKRPKNATKIRKK